ncbi:MAG: hypothetical protein OJF62_002177 [Pseudolabrys sp.]|nr:hypothetical protein [Pseudolabrys sp.]
MCVGAAPALKLRQTSEPATPLPALYGEMRRIRQPQVFL